MTDERFNQNWFQARIFSRVPMPQQYPDLLVRVARPFLGQAPALRFFFSHYWCPLGTDDADTNIQALPQDFRFGEPSGRVWHGSLRLRFREPTDERAKLINLLNGLQDFWFSEVLPCTPEGVLPPDRFATDQQPIPRARRIRLVAELLQANCRLVLDNLEHQGGTWQFQENLHDENIRLRSVVKSVEHMILNVWRRNDGTPFPIVGFEHFQL